jgi:hypothetical protein
VVRDFGGDFNLGKVDLAKVENVGPGTGEAASFRHSSTLHERCVGTYDYRSPQDGSPTISPVLLWEIELYMPTSAPHLDTREGPVI